MKIVLIHGNKNEELQREIKLRELSSSLEIKTVIRKLDELKIENEGYRVNTVRTYKEAVTNKRQTRPEEIRKQETSGRQTQCYNCDGYGHWARDCQQRSKRKCRGCNEVGHIQRECPNIQCNRCNLKGHQMANCYTNLQRRR